VLKPQVFQVKARRKRRRRKSRINKTISKVPKEQTSLEQLQTNLVNLRLLTTRMIVRLKRKLLKYRERRKASKLHRTLLIK